MAALADNGTWPRSCRLGYKNLAPRSNNNDNASVECRQQDEDEDEEEKVEYEDVGEDSEDAAGAAAAVDEDTRIYFRDKRNSVGLKSADECHFTSSARSKATTLTRHTRQ